ncbi:MAG: helix-turn-helix domain-containing protein [Clostridia bacterium]|nr:helix-turn-helix domain-containing protein [Clostridia bacterium]
MENNILGETIRNARRKCGLSQRELAKSAGISAAQICRIESGQTKKSHLEVIISIGNVLRVDFHDILKEVGFNEEKISAMYVKHYIDSTSGSENWINTSNLSLEDRLLITKMYNNLSKLSKKDKSIIDFILG